MAYALSGQCTDSRIAANGHPDDWRLFGDHGLAGWWRAAGFLGTGKRTMNLFVIDSLVRNALQWVVFCSVFTEFECLRRHNFAHFTSSPLEKRVIGHELLDCGWTEAEQRAI